MVAVTEAPSDSSKFKVPDLDGRRSPFDNNFN
jgi:hypothetical protein